MSHAENAKTYFFLHFTPPATATHLTETGKSNAAQSKTIQQ